MNRLLLLAALGLIGTPWRAYPWPAVDPGEDWTYTSMTWSQTRDGLRGDGLEKSHAFFSVGGRDSIRVEAIVSVDSVLGSGWKIAGVTLYRDFKNYWHLALVEAPAGQGTRFFELKRMRDGIWGDDLGLKWVEQRAATNIWHNRKGYRLSLEKRGLRVTGCIRDLRGKLIYQAAVDEEVGADGEIYPGLDNGGFSTVFTRFRYYLPKKYFFAESPISKKHFYRLMKNNDTCWLLDPEDRRALSIGCELVKYHYIWCQALGYAPYHRNVEKLFGSEAEWARDVAGKLRAWGFNTVGGSDRNEEISKQGLAFAPILRMGQRFSEIAAIVTKTFWTGFPDVFDQRFPRFCSMIAEMECRPWRDDPDLLGYYIDNELEWFGKDGTPWSLFTSAMRLGPKSPAKLAAVSLLRQRHRLIDGFNKTWFTDIKSWEALAETSLALTPETSQAREDAEAYVSLCAEKYFRITTTAIRRADPNHLILGTRFAWVAPEPAWQAAGRYCDVVSFNCYPRVNIYSGTIPRLVDTLKHRYNICQRPLLISEWSFPALDAGLPSTHGAGMRVDDQVQRAYCAARFQEEVLRIPFVVGTSWFMWTDEPALGVTDSFPENSNYGLVDVKHRPYGNLISSLGSVNRMAVEIHRGLGSSWPTSKLRAALFSKYGTKLREARPDVRMRQGSLVVDNQEVRLVLIPGRSAGIDSILWHGIPIGSYHPLLWQRRRSNNWLRPNKVTEFWIEDTPGNGLALSFRAESIPEDTAWCGFSVSFRVILPPSGSFFLAEVTEITSLDNRPWELAGYYHYIPSWLGGDTAGDIPRVPQVKNYWLERGGWSDEKAGLHFGALALEVAGWIFQPYIDSQGRQHPDIFHSVHKQMRRDEVFSVRSGPMVIYMGREDRSRPPWAIAAFQSWEWIKAKE